MAIETYRNFRSHFYSWTLPYLLCTLFVLLSTGDSLVQDCVILIWGWHVARLVWSASTLGGTKRHIIQAILGGQWPVWLSLAWVLPCDWLHRPLPDFLPDFLEVWCYPWVTLAKPVLVGVYRGQSVAFLTCFLWPIIILSFAISVWYLARIMGGRRTPQPKQ